VVPPDDFKISNHETIQRPFAYKHYSHERSVQDSFAQMLMLRRRRRHLSCAPTAEELRPLKTIKTTDARISCLTILIEVPTIATDTVYPATAALQAKFDATMETLS
jgi:hypothetical protein